MFTSENAANYCGTRAKNTESLLSTGQRPVHPTHEDRHHPSALIKTLTELPTRTAQLAWSSPDVAAGVSSSRDTAAMLPDVTFNSCTIDE